MKSYIAISAALAHLVAGQTPVAPAASNSATFWTDGKPTASVGAPAPGASAAICGQGFTYCGYILRDHQNFREEDIVRVYCASNKDNCVDGKTKTDPLQALFVCLPPQSQAIPVPNDEEWPTNSHGDHDVNKQQHNHHIIKNKNIHGLRNRRQAAPSGLTGGGGSDTCSSTPTTGNQLALLCSCGNKCLNPKEDHIGRCDTPCSQ
ncbi:hypothetical protein QBC37DRAFT_288174 [Rhypophila decipiens]|uniref:Uncharacterized protein n=1 Tax=Rhypophila decipiens TaxID=261697 RepID=A0AAN6Y462_9PEZI|nr:hypothetical protein QBC37DRAFT_288174 [Rhypophila decipiens]